MGKTIRTNDLYLYMPGLDKVTFAVDEYWVSKGEDFVIEKGRLKVDVKLEDRVTGKWKFTVEAGRHKTEEVAQWFGGKIGFNEKNKDKKCIAETEHDKFPEELNFAFSGVLSFEKDGVNLHLPVVIGQGSHGNTNNWWIGSAVAKTFENKKKEWLSILATDENNKGRYWLYFATVDNMTFEASIKKVRMNVEVKPEPLKEYKDEKYKLYEMYAEYDQELVEDIITKFTELKECYQDVPAVIDAAAFAAVKNALQMKISTGINLQPFGCTAFSTSTSDGKVYMGRNYDFSIDTSCVCVHTTPRRSKGETTPFKSIAFAALSNVQNEQEIGKCEDENLMLLPFVCLDGINEKGVSIAVLVVDIKDGMGITRQKEKEKNIFTTLAIRYVLDYADSTASAVELLSNFNMFAAGGKDYHFFISDVTGDSRVVEYNYKKKNREYTVTSKKIATNFYAFDEETFGHGHKRYKKVEDIIKEKNLEEKHLWKALEKAAQKPEEGNPTSNTQWSILFDNTNRSAEIAIRRHFDEDERRTFSVPKET